MSLRRELYRAGLMTQHGQLTCVEALTHALGPDADGGSSSSGQNEDSRNSSSRGGPGASSSKDRSSVRLPYLDAWVKESMRLHTTAPNGTLRRVGAGGIQLGPYALEEGETGPMR